MWERDSSRSRGKEGFLAEKELPQEYLHSVLRHGMNTVNYLGIVFGQKSIHRIESVLLVKCATVFLRREPTKYC
jgi:hypothetical protein